VDKSPRRVSGKAALSACHRIKLRVAVILADPATVYFTVAPANLWPGDLIGKRSGSDCNHSHSSDSDGIPACTSSAKSK
jgi:hypothetical protein